MATIICPCGVLVSLPEVYHRNSPGYAGTVDQCHDCIWHNSPECTTCVTYTQISAFLDVARTSGEDVANQVLDDELGRDREPKGKGIWW